MKRISGFLTLRLLPLLLASPLLDAASVPPPEKLLPGDTIGVLTVPDFARARAALDKAPASQLWNDPSMKPFREKFMGKLTAEIITPLEKEMGIKFSEYTGLAQGQLTVGISVNGPKDAAGNPDMGITLLMDAQAKSGQLQTNLTTLRRKWVDSGKQIRTDKIRDVEFTTLIFNSDDLSKVMEKVFPNPAGAPKDDDDDKPSKVEWMMGQSGSLLLLGNSTKDLERILVNQGGGGAGTLGEQSLFAASHQAHFRDANAYGWINLKSILDQFTKNAKDGAGAGAQGFGLTPDKIITAIGLNGLNALALSFRDTSDGPVIALNVDAPESARRGLVKMLAFEPKDSAPPAFVPADTVQFSRLRLDLPKAWDTLERTLSDAMPQISGVVKMVLDNAGKDQDPNFDLRKNLIQNLGDDIISIVKAPRSRTLEDLTASPSLTLISSPRPEQLASSIRALTALMPAQASKFKEREFLGRKVYALGLPPSMGPGGKTVERTLHYSASGGYVALTMDIALLEEYLRSSDGSGKALRDTPGLSEAAQKVGGMNSGFFSFENQRETARAQFETLKKESGTLANLFAAAPFAARFGMAGNNDKFKEWIDFSLLPPFEQISKYFHHAVSAGAITPQGFSFKMLTVTPPELRK